MKRLTYLFAVLFIATALLQAQVMQQIVVNSPYPSGSTIAIVQSAAAQCTSSVTSCACTLSSSVASGNLLIINGSNGDQNAYTPSAADTFNTYHNLTGDSPVFGAGGGNSDFFVWTINGSTHAGGVTITASKTSTAESNWKEACFEVSSSTGWPSGTSALDKQNSGNITSGGTSITCATITPTSAGEFDFCGLELDGAPTASSFAVTGSGYVEQNPGGSAGTGYLGLTRDVAATNTSAGAGAQTPGFTWTTSTTGADINVLFNPN